MQIEMVAIDAIREYERNPRVIGDDAIAAVAQSIQSFGFKVPVVVDGDGVLIAGHTRLRAARKLGLDTVPVIRATDLAPEQVRAFRLADNQVASLSKWDYDLLPIELGELQGAGFDWTQLGFDQDELAKLLGGEIKQGLTDPDDVPEPPDEAITKPGDLWIMGEHRLLCGDSSSPADLDLLIAVDPVKALELPAGSDAKPAILPIHLVNTDPPYNVKVEPRSNNAIAAGLSSFGEHGLMHHQSFDRHRAEKKRADSKKETKRTASKYHGFDVATGGQSGKATHKKMRPKDRPLANDFVSDEEFDKLLAAWFGNIARVLLPGRGFYIWGGYANIGNYPPVLKASGLYFSQSIIWDKQHPVLTRKDYMGAHEWCQPPDTKVLTVEGTSRLSELRDGDRVVSFYPHSSAVVGLREGLEVQVAQRPYDGKLYGVTVGEKQTWCTAGHLWTVRLTSDYPRKWCVYLMRRGAWWRVGVTKMRTTWGFGLKGRLCSEHGDEGWILSLHDSHADARMHEQLISVRFGIPQTCWKEDPQPQRRKHSHIEEFYANLDLIQLDRSADAALLAHHRLRGYPFVENNETRAKFGARQSIQVRTCNLLTEIIEVPVPVGGQKAQWQPIRAIDVQEYSGAVHSLGVAKHQHYIADGIVTHNCFYGWREGAAHVYLGPNNATDLWHVKKINPAQMEHLTSKPAELAVRAMQYSSRPGENVLDLFGGSGSTLIAAEQTGRRCFMMEIDTLYADVVVDRFQRFSGKPAVLQRTGTSPIPMKPREENMR